MSDVEINFDMPNLKEKFDRNSDKFAALIAATMQTQRAMIFDKEGAYNGRGRWKPLKYRVGQILSDTGTLRRSIGPSNDGRNPARQEGSIVEIGAGTVTIGTSIAYGAFHDRGTSKIPQREFSNLTNEDIQEISETVTNAIAHVLEGGTL